MLKMLISATCLGGSINVVSKGSRNSRSGLAFVGILVNCYYWWLTKWKLIGL